MSRAVSKKNLKAEKERFNDKAGRLVPNVANGMGNDWKPHGKWAISVLKSIAETCRDYASRFSGLILKKRV